MQTALFEGFRLAYLDEGSGPPLVLVHGFTGTAQSHLGELCRYFREHYRVIAPDLRGYGASRPPNRDFPADFYARDAADLAALLNRLCSEPAVVLGFSDGAESALLLAAARPDLVRGVVAWGVSGVISAAMLERVRDWLPASAWGERRAAWRAEIIETQGEEQFVPLIEGWVAAAEAIYAAGGDICRMAATQIRCPVLLINGEGEEGNLPEDVRLLAEAISDCRLQFVPDAGHAIHEDQPALFRARVEAFLAELATR